MHQLPAAGTPLPPLDRPRWTAAHIVRWMGAQQNWDRIHFDQAFCRDVAKLAAPVINGALKQHLIVQFLRAALPGAWPWRVDYQFVGPDHVGQKLQVRGTAGESRTEGAHGYVEVAVEIVNLDTAQVTTRGRATLVMRLDGTPLLAATGLDLPPDLALPREPAEPDATTEPALAAQLGTVLDTRTSEYPLDLSRLRLFADAVLEPDPVHFDPDVPSPWGVVVAPPLFPMHALEARPGTYPLSEELDAQGREGVNEVGRDLAQRFGFGPAGGMNAGNRVQVHSLLCVGERVRVRSVLAGIRRRTGPRGGDMLFVETLNDYEETGGRSLLTERQTVVYRLGAGR